MEHGITQSLHLAAHSGSHEVLTSLLSKSKLPADKLLISTSEDGRTPLHYTVEHGHFESVMVLLDYGADPTIASDCHPPPIHLACSLGKVDIVKLMVEKCGDGILQSRDQQEKTTLHSCASSIFGYKLISYLVNKGVSVSAMDSNGFTPLSSAIQFGNVHVVEELLNQGGCHFTDKCGSTALHRAVLSERIEVFKKIACSDVAHVMAKTADNQGYFPIQRALKLGHHDMVVSLLEISHEMFMDPNGNNYLHLAASFCNHETLLYLLGMPSAQNAINEVNSSGSTPLHYAARSDVNMVKELLDYGAVVHRDNAGHTPFMCACLSGNLVAAKLLYSRSQYQRDWADYSGQTALHLAVDSKNSDVVTFCLDIGMTISYNEENLSFFDIILHLNERKLAEAVVNHKRWEECIDTCSANEVHPILRILERMPEIYEIILNRSHLRSSLDPSHPDFWEEFNFKCLDITITDTQVERDPHHANPGCRSTVSKLAGNSSNITEATSIDSKKRHAVKQDKNSFTVIHKLIELRLESCMRHPVVIEFIKLRWKWYGLQFRATVMLIPLILAVLFSVLLVQLPTPRQSIPVPLPLSENTTENNTTMLSPSGSISTRLQILFGITLVFAVLDLLLSFLGAYVNGVRLFLSFSLSINVWTNFIASVCIIIYITSALIVGVPQALWNAAAVGVLFAWFSVGFNLQFIQFLNIGVYVAMMVSTLKLAVIVAASLFVFLLGFVFSFHVVLGTVPGLQYDTIGLSTFSTLHSLIGTTDFMGIVGAEQEGELRFSVAVFFLLVVLIIMLPIVFTNLLIGLAIGDITRIQQEATFTRQVIEVHALSWVDMKLIPRCLMKKHKKYHRNFSRKQGCAALVAKLFHAEK